MGCVFNFTKLKAQTKEAAVVEAHKVIEQAAWEHGHGGYSGSFAEARGAAACEHVADNAADAEQWLDENAEKWEAALLVQDKAGNWYMGANCSS